MSRRDHKIRRSRSPSQPGKVPEQKYGGDNSAGETPAPTPEDYPLVPLTNAVKHLEETYKAEQNESATQQHRQLAVQRFIALFTFAGFVAAAIYAYISYGQWVDLRKNYQVERRSFIEIIPKTEQIDLSALKQMSYDVILKNIGHSPARGILLECLPEVVPNSAPPSLFSVKTQTLYSIVDVPIIFPGETRDATCMAGLQANGPPMPFTDYDRQQMVAGKTYLSEFARVWYTDEFGTHWTHWCSWQSAARVLAIYNAKSCTDYNDADTNP